MLLFCLRVTWHQTVAMDAGLTGPASTIDLRASVSSIIHFRLKKSQVSQYYPGAGIIKEIVLQVIY